MLRKNSNAEVRDGRYRLQCLRENQAIAKSVPQGRLNFIAVQISG
jgi:hypothetical protein